MPHTRFQGAEIPKHHPYSLPIVINHGQGLTPTAVWHLPGSDLEGRRYRLELCNDPGGLRPQVPSPPGFPSDP
jgi:hypothetical protein